MANPENQSSDEQLPVTVQQDLSQKLHALLHVVTDLSTWVAAYEGRQDQGEASVMASPPTLPPRRRARCQVTPSSYIKLDPEVCRCVADSMKRATPLNADTNDKNPSDDEKHPPPRRGSNLKSGIDRTGTSMVIHKVTWFHDIVYTSDGKPASYQDLSIPSWSALSHYHGV